jgi:hypothetical protein
VEPYEFYTNRKLLCKILDGLSRCKEYVWRGRLCAGSGIITSIGGYFYFIFRGGLFPMLIILLASYILSEKCYIKEDKEETKAYLTRA